MKHDINPFTLEIIKDSLMAIGDEMFYALSRTSMSPIIYEVLDYATGLTDAKGQLLTQGNGVTSFIGMLSTMVQEVLNKYDNGATLKPGDIIIMNDPYKGGGSHLSDVGLCMPIFYEGELVAFSANKGHWTEVGGKDPGSFTSDSTDIFQEGLQFPAIKLFNEGKVNDSVVEIIEANVRFPDLSLGDLWAQVAALKTGEKRFLELCEKHGKDQILYAINHLLDQGERVARAELKKLPKGTFTAEDFIDDDGFGNGPFPIKVKVTITDDEFVVDYRGSHSQVNGPVNCSYYALMAGVRTLFLAITKPTQHINDGIFRPLKVITDRKSILSAERPAPVSINFEGRLCGADLIWKALAKELPDRLVAGHFLSICSITLTGNHPDTNEPFLIVEPSVGGWGGGKGMDGNNAQFCVGPGETYNVPIEVAEKRFGVIIDEYSLNTDGQGAGEFTGGFGVVRAYRTLTDNQTVTCMFGRHKFAPWAIHGGKEGSPNKVIIEKSDGTVLGPYGLKARIPLDKNDVVKLITGTGGGYGNPLNREPEKVQRDVLNEYITVKEAEELYGVIINEDTYEIIGFTDQRKQLASVN